VVLLFRFNIDFICIIADVSISVGNFYISMNDFIRKHDFTIFFVNGSNLDKDFDATVEITVFYGKI